MMKLLSYHIENYGKLKNLDGNFSGGLTCFCEKNGFGKSTLASFIKAMFYGLPSYTVATKGFNDRQRFYPFEGGKFGGNITFESGGKLYKIERFFDKKSTKGDECKVFQNGAPYDGFGEEIGKALFGLDEESFKKTVFITADEIEISSTHSINEKLNRTVEVSDEENGFEGALALLEEAKKSLKAARGNNDKISRKKTEISELNADIKNLKDMGEGLAESYAERERLSGEMDRLDKELRIASERNLVLQKWETFDSMSAQKREKEEALFALRARYPLGIPQTQERAVLQESLQKDDRLRGSLQTAALRSGKEESLLILERKFANGVPMSAAIGEKQQKLSRLSMIGAERKRLSQREKTRKEKTLEGKFSAGFPGESELQEKRALVEEYKRRENEMKTFSEALFKTTQAQTDVKKKTNKLVVFWFVMGAVLLGAGLGLLAVLLPLGIGLAVGGGLLLAVAAIIRRKTSVNATLPMTNTQFNTVSLRAEIKVLEEKLRAFMVPYGYYGEAGIVYDFSTLEEDVKEYKAYLVAEEERLTTIQTLAREEGLLYEEVSSFLQSYGESAENLQNGLNRLTASVASYQALQEDKAAAEENERVMREQLAESEKLVSEILQKYGLKESVATMDGLKGLELDARSFSELTRELELLDKNLSDYKERNNLNARPEEETDVDGLHDNLSLLRKQLADLDKKIAEIEREVEKLPDAENALALAEETLKEYKEKHALLGDTIEALKGAEQTLKDKYVAPIKGRFSTYAEALERVLGEKIGMDKDFCVVFERGGESRSERHLSAGERSLCALCLRLALIDNMYETEQPFIVMDDPFVHLDETHMERTKALIRELAAGKQIVYFCCHESRKI